MKSVIVNGMIIVKSVDHLAAGRFSAILFLTMGQQNLFVDIVERVIGYLCQVRIGRVSITDADCCVFDCIPLYRCTSREIRRYAVIVKRLRPNSV
jgi:hypothetical protein